MIEINDFKASNGHVMKPLLRVEENRLARLRERQKRQRKEKLYSSARKLI